MKKNLALKIIGIDCSGCAKNFEKKLLAEPGILDARINIAYKKLFVDYDSTITTENDIFAIVKNSGYSIIKDDDLKKSKRDSKTSGKMSFAKSIFQRKEVYTTAISGVLLLVGALLEFVFKFKLASLIVFIFGTLIGGVFIFKKAFFSAKSLNLDINVLMTIAAIAALIIGEEVEATSIVFLFSIAELAESFSVERAKNSIEKLIDYAPSEAIVIIDKKERILLAEDVEVNSHILVKPGQRIPLDGEIFSGNSYVNQAPITGESLPVSKTVGDEVFAGTLNEDGALTIKVTKPYEEMFLKKIIALVENADQRAPIDRYVDSFAKYYTPIMFLVASLTMAIPPLITGDPFIEWVYVALIVLVISCPCAVVLSTPIAIVTALSRSARHGVLIKGGFYIESISKANVFAFDKTGTLTVGHPQVEEIITDGDFSEEELLKITGSLESNSSHPIARAIKERMHENDIEPYHVEDFKSIAGIGIQGEIDAQLWTISSPRLIMEQELMLSDSLASEISVNQSEMKTVIIISTDSTVHGIITISDQMKPHAKGLICELKNIGAKKIVMLTGDNAKTAARVANELGIEDYRAELLPDQKMDYIEKLNEDYGHVVMLGDGINDAPSLALAEVGIAMGASGSDIALDTANVVLMTDRLDALHYLITLSKKSMRIIKQNIAIAIIIKLVLFVLSYMGLISLWVAVLIGDMGVSLFVIFNTILRARGKKMGHLNCDQNLCLLDESLLNHSKKIACKDACACVQCQI
ncbi:MAG: heavy metal translocating P-type ATPase [Candidatus Heimdallarchaeaceae archaeon]